MGLFRQAYIIDLIDVVDDLDLESHDIAVSLHVVGYDGQLPNLDMVAFPLSLYPAIQVEDTLGHDHAPFLPTYTRRLSSLMSWFHISNRGASGLHAELLRENIDALTMKFRPSSRISGFKTGDIAHIVANSVKMSCFLHGEHVWPFQPTFSHPL